MRRLTNLPTLLVLLAAQYIAVGCSSDSHESQVGQAGSAGEIASGGDQGGSEAGRSGSERGGQGGEVTASRQVRGRVTDPSGVGLKLATVSVGSTSAKTNGDGEFTLDGLPAVESASIVATKAGYTEASESVPTAGDATVDVRLLPVEQESVSSAEEGCELSTDDGLILEVPAGTFVAEDGTPMTGEVLIVYGVVDTPDELLAAPGELVTTTANGAEVGLSPLGMVEVRYTDADGNPVFYAGSAGQSVLLGIPIAPLAAELVEEGDRVPVYSFDVATNSWSLETEGVVTDNAVLAEVNHFTWWMAGLPVEEQDASCVMGTLSVDGGQLESYAGVSLSATATDSLFSTTLTASADGRFCVSVPQGVSLSVSGRYAGEDGEVSWTGAVTTSSGAASCGESGCTSMGTLLGTVEPEEPETTGEGGSGNQSGVCGNGRVEASEECDDANEDETDGCLSDCTASTPPTGLGGSGNEGGRASGGSDSGGTTGVEPICGDGVVQDGEDCDDGNDDELDGCLRGCVRSGSGGSGSGGDGNVAGEASEGGALGVGGVLGQGGTSSVAEGGSLGLGGLLGDGGSTSPGAGGSEQTGGATGVGGVSSVGGAPVTGRGGTSSGGATGAGGAATSGAGGGGGFGSCGNGQVDGDEECDDGNGDRLDSCTNDCKLTFCGDGTVQTLEDCDLGPRNSDAGSCSASCEAMATGCGNGTFDEGEDCDDGNNSDTDDCTIACVGPQCGDGVTNGFEECDDANDVNGDECTNGCRSATCGDGIVQAWSGEVCDGGAACGYDCQPRDGVGDGAGGAGGEGGSGACGNGLLNEDEECDDGNGDRLDSCTNDCKLTFCGDGTVQTLEDCDLGPRNSDAGSCSTSCAAMATGCGNGTFDEGEDCDDGNNSDIDDCTIACAAPQCGDGVTNGFEHCDDDNDVNDDECTNACRLARCGDGIVQAWSGEVCDGGAACGYDCQPRDGVGDGAGGAGGEGGSGACGNGLLNEDEECDDGNGDRLDSCTNDCKLTFCGDGAVQTVEACDLGPRNSDAGSCSTGCEAMASGCGNGTFDEGEDCDDGNNSDTDDCTIACVAPQCGDGVTNGFEHCDDDNDVNDDECTNACHFAACPDGIIQAWRGEVCDGGGACGADCQPVL